MPSVEAAGRMELLCAEGDCMKKHIINLEVKLTEEQYRSFLMFDQLQRQQTWKLPVLGGVGLIVLGGILLYATRLWVPTVVLTLLGMGIPTVTMLQFWRGLKSRCAQLALSDQPKSVYRVLFGDYTVAVQQGNAEREVEWDDLYALYAIDGNIYLYLDKTSGYLLPHDSFAQVEFDLWKLLREEMDENKIFIQLPQKGKQGARG